MALSKSQRLLLREKFGGRCAYCGQPLGDKWHADHIEHVERQMKHIPGRGSQGFFNVPDEVLMGAAA